MAIIDDSQFEDGLHEECGVVGIWNANDLNLVNSFDDAARLAFYSLFSLQHRGQEAAGIAVLNGRNIRVFKKLGLITNIFKEDFKGLLQ